MDVTPATGETKESLGQLLELLKVQGTFPTLLSSELHVLWVRFIV